MSNLENCTVEKKKRGRPANLTRAGMGRPKGVANKYQADIKAMIHEALHNAGGVKYLVSQAEKNPVAFIGLVSKVIPKEVKATVQGSLEMVLADRLKDARNRV